MPNESQSYLLMASAGAIVLAVSSLLAAFANHRRIRGFWIPPRPLNGIAWGGGTLFVVFAAAALLPKPLQSLLETTGFYEARYGFGFPKSPLPETEPTEDERQATHLKMLWAKLLETPILLVGYTLALRWQFRTKPASFGFRLDGIWNQLFRGWLGWLLITPIVFAIFAVALYSMIDRPDAHPLTDLGSRAQTVEWVLVVVEACLFAPFLEEVLFRGFLLFWLLKPARRSGVATPLELEPLQRVKIVCGIGVLIGMPGLLTALGQGMKPGLTRAVAPVVFVVTLLPLVAFLPQSLALRRRMRIRSAQEFRAILVSALLFAIFHIGVWPSPIPLFVLGAGLAYLVTRSRSLIPAIVAHGLFNAVSVVYLLIGGK